MASVSVWVVEEWDVEGWYPLDTFTHNKKREAMELATGRRGYLREIGMKPVKVRVVEYRRVEKEDRDAR